MNDKFIIDVCCGGKMFWVNRKHPNTVFQDIRKDVLPLMEKYGRNFTVEPDVIGDFTNMNYEDKSFKLVIFDPPQLYLGSTSWMAKKYGTLKDMDWANDIKKGFLECYRILDDFGILLFKWNDGAIKIKKIEPLFPTEPLIVNRVKTKDKMTYWYVFMKIPKKEII